MADRVFDIHPHIISGDTSRYPRDPIGGVASDWAEERPVSIEEYVAAMDEAGVDKAAIVQASTCYGYDNSYLADAIAKYPDRTTGVGCVDIISPGAGERVRGWLERGITGLRLYTGGSKMAFDVSQLDDPRSFEGWEVASEAGIPICVQTRPMGFPNIRFLAEKFPRARIIIDHLARADISDGPPYRKAEPLFALADLKNVYLKVTPRTFDLASRAPATPETFFPRLVSVFGADRIAFGSNFPSSEGALAAIVDQARAGLRSLPDDVRNQIFVGTAQALYPKLAD